ncbi:hypothetical protein KFL_000490190 [Klebsormidium nitens]|uniref:Uncharacterized protein n=1 Tax=Klebsormidium nitens TaxID=105231 RepID=A0A0U9HKV2_KLENI|nr:hypothetical protein KFL_000490190 [Klebsormidium nitens]|eukprot:GAQ80229.1 hypothetical protein KFL_000490190 [Klebsormidium nitens]
MFFCTDAGCAAGEHCALRHDEKRREWCAENAVLERSRSAPPPRPAADDYESPPWEEPAPAPPRIAPHHLRRSWPGRPAVGASSQQTTYVLSQRV